MRGSFTIIYPVTWLRYTSLTPGTALRHTWGQPGPEVMPSHCWDSTTNPVPRGLPGLHPRAPHQLLGAGKGECSWRSQHRVEARWHKSIAPRLGMQLREQAKTCLSCQERNSPPFRKKRKENYSQVTDCMEKEEKKGSAQVSIYLFIKQGKTEGWHQRAKVNLFKHNCLQSVSDLSSSDNLAILTQIL